MGVHGTIASVSLHIYAAIASWKRAHMPRGARPHDKSWICTLWRRGVRLGGAPRAAGRVDADVEVQVLG